MPNSPEEHEEIGFDDLLEALRGRTADQVAQFFADIGLELSPDITTFTPICHRCGAIKHEMVLVAENVPAEEFSEEPSAFKNMVLCCDCAEEKLGITPSSSSADAPGVKLWRERVSAVQEIFYDLPEDRDAVAVCHFKDGFKPSGSSPKHDYCLRSEDWDRAVKDLPHAPGDEPPKKKRVRVESEAEESTPTTRNRVRA